MGIWNRRGWLRWLVPGLATVLVAGGAATARAIVTEAPRLPSRTAAQLLADLHGADVAGFSGTVVLRSDLGLPALPERTPDGRARLGALLSGSHTLRMWYAGPDRFRVALLGTLGQSDVIRDGRDVWIWESTRNEAAHLTLPAPLDGPGRPDAAATATPTGAAEAVLGALEATTEVTTGDTPPVAGRPARELILTPRTADTRVRQVRLAVDAEHHLPLRVRVYGEAAEPAFEVRFTQITFEPPDPEQFRFNPPPGATVDEPDLLSLLSASGAKSLPEATVVGQGWSRVLVLRLPAEAEQHLTGLAALLPEVSGEWGTGRMLSGTLFTALLTDDGRLLVGPVTPERLGRAAADPAALRS